ncbi:MAG: S8 family serine peptidase [Aestuariivirga sp.]
MRTRIKLENILTLGLVLAAIGSTPARAGLFSPVPAVAIQEPPSLNQQFHTVALKCKPQGRCKRRKPANQQHHPKPDQPPDKPKSGKDNPKGGKHPTVLVFKPVYRPGGICIGGRIIEQRCQCQPGEARVTVAKRVFSCRQRDTASTSAAGNTPGAGNQTVSATAATQFAPDEVLLILPIGNGPQLEEQIAARYGLDILQQAEIALLGRRIVRCRISGGRAVDDVLAAMQGDGQIPAAQRNYFYRRQAAAPGTASAGIQYALEKLGINAAHAVATGVGSLIAVVDTGIDLSHPDFRAAIAASYDATGGADPIADPHGTAIAGIIVAHGAIEGVAPGARVLDVRVFQADASGAGSIATTVSLLRGLQWAEEKHARIVNLSLAGERDGLIGEAIAAMIAKNIIIVAAAGNAGAEAPEAFPAAFADVIAVTATDAGDGLYAAANRGSYISLAAPGVDVIAPALYGAYQMNSGTSFAAAHVSGIIALMLEHDSTISNEKIRAALQSSAKDLGPPGKDDQFGAGRASAVAALQQ